MDLEGGCFCGAIRYKVEGPPLDAGYCHCRMCQRTTAAPAVPWATWRRAGFAWLGAEPGTLRSSKHGRRRFCRECGTHLVFEAADQPGEIDISTVTLDLPEAVRPQYHIWTRSRLGWFETADTLPRFPDDGPDGAQRRGREDGTG
jgi:hypothetical protein